MDIWGYLGISGLIYRAQKSRYPPPSGLTVVPGAVGEVGGGTKPLSHKPCISHSLMTRKGSADIILCYIVFCFIVLYSIIYYYIVLY